MKLAAVALAAILFAPQETEWKTDFKAALKEAAASKKLVTLVFLSKDRKACVKFRNEGLTDPAVVTALKQYVCVRIDPEGTDDENRLWQEKGSPMPPMTIIFEPDGKQLAVVQRLNTKIYGELMAAISPAYFNQILPARTAIAKDATDPLPHRTLGEAYMKLENSADSAKHFTIAAELMIGKGDKAGALDLSIAQLQKYYDVKWYSAARGACSRIADLDPDNKSKQLPMAAWVLGMASCDEGRWGEAIDGLKSAIEKYKGHELQPKMMFTLASAYMYSKDIDSAITTFETIMKDFPDTEAANLSQTQSEKLRDQRQRKNEGK